MSSFPGDQREQKASKFGRTDFCSTRTPLALKTLKRSTGSGVPDFYSSCSHSFKLLLITSIMIVYKSPFKRSCFISVPAEYL